MENISKLEIIKEKFHDINFYTNIYLHSLILFTFLSILFITFIAKVSSKAFNFEVSSMVTKQIDDKLKNVNKNQLSSIPSLDKILTHYSKPEIGANNNNRGLFHSVMLLNISLWISFIIFVFIIKLNKGTHLNIKDILLENMIAFVFIGMTEYLFFTKIAMNYIPVEPSFITVQFFEQIKSTLAT
jgi:hypothetical protein